MYAININEEHRILLATYEQYANTESILVAELPTGETKKEKDITNWLYIDGQYEYDPLPDPEPPAPSELDIYMQQTDAAICELYEMIAGGE